MKKKGRIRVRRIWKIKPVTRVKESNKRYDRKKTRRETQRELETEDWG